MFQPDSPIVIANFILQTQSQNASKVNNEDVWVKQNKNNIAIK